MLVRAHVTSFSTASIINVKHSVIKGNARNVILTSKWHASVAKKSAHSNVAARDLSARKFVGSRWTVVNILVRKCVMTVLVSPVKKLPRESNSVHAAEKRS